METLRVTTCSYIRNVAFFLLYLTALSLMQNTYTHTNTFTNLVNQVPKRTLICLNHYCWAVLATKLAFISSFFFLFCKCVRNSVCIWPLT